MKPEERTCYECDNYSVCELFRNLDKAIKEHIYMLGENYKKAAGFPPSIAPICTYFKERPNESE